MKKMLRGRTKSASEGSDAERRLVNPNNLRKRPDLSGLSRQEREAFYAGAKFDTVPENAVIPIPPTKWIMQEGTRSQSSPSSPITVSGKPSTTITPSSSLPIKLDVESLFGTNKPSSDFSDSKLGQLLKSATVPSQRAAKEQNQRHGIPAGVTTDNSASQTQRMGIEAVAVVVRQPRESPEPQSTSSSEIMKKVSGISGKDLMGLLSAKPHGLRERERPKSVNNLVSPSCQFEFDHLDNADSHYKDITNHLKSILKVSITAA